MKICSAIGWYFPDSSGGTEIYVDRLTTLLRDSGVDSVIAAATDNEEESNYEWHDLTVHRYPVPEATRKELIDGLAPQRIERFETWLRDQRFDIYHQHSWTRGCGLHHLRAAKRAGLPTIVTFHMPSAICLRDTMMLNGTGPCDGRVNVERCTTCWGEARGLPSAVASGLAWWPALGALAVAAPGTRLETALLTPRLVARRKQELADVADLADRIVAPCRWMLEALALNGIPREKLVYCPQGVDAPEGFRSTVPPRERTGVLRIGFLGRWNRIKGIDVIVDAVLALPGHVNVELVVRALPGDAAYEQQVRARARADRRIRFESPVPADEIFSALADLDVLSVPSRCLETGPLVVLEAFAAGRPVLGSHLGGIAELVHDGVNGRLLPPGDVEAWSRSIAELAATPDFSWTPRPPRSARDVAQQMLSLYRNIRDQIEPGQTEGRTRGFAQHVV